MIKTSMNPTAVMNDVASKIERRLTDVGLMFRLFKRTKSQQSLEIKLENDPDYGLTKKIQDLIGLRVVLYFNDDIQTVRDILSNLYTEKSKDNSIDIMQNDQFKAVRFNIIYFLDEESIKTLNLDNLSNKIDTTFELQIRTIFSEGWHEVEHDLRYKNKKDWNGYDYQSRLLNGVYAALESSEWTMVKIFDELAYNHYKNANWPAMLRQKFRLRFTQDDLSEELTLLFNDRDLAKKFFRLDRNKVIKSLNAKEFNYPLSLNNFVYFTNLLDVYNDAILSMTPKLMIADFNSAVDM